MDEHYRQHYRDTEKPLTHGMSATEFDLHAEQQRLHQVQEIQCNIDPNYTISLVEAETFYRVSQEVRYHNSGTGEKESKARISKYHIRQFNHMLEKGLFKGEVKIIHDPLKYREALLKAKQVVGQAPAPDMAGKHQSRLTPEEILEQGPGKKDTTAISGTGANKPDGTLTDENGNQIDLGNDPGDIPDPSESLANQAGEAIQGHEEVPDPKEGPETLAQQPAPEGEEDIPVINLDNVDEPTNLDNDDKENN